MYFLIQFVFAMFNRKRGGSVDNLLDDLGDHELDKPQGASGGGGGVSAAIDKNKSVSSKNLATLEIDGGNKSSAGGNLASQV